MNEIPQFESPCRYRDGEMYCSHGVIYVFEPGREMATVAMMDSQVLRCPACKGEGHVLTPAGEQLIDMIWRWIEPKIEELLENA